MLTTVPNGSQGDIMLEGSLVSWKRGARSHKGLKRTVLASEKCWILVVPKLFID